MRPIGVDLFAGAGGMSLGFEQAGFDVVAAVEIDPVHCAVHEYNFPECAVISKSVSEVTAEEIREAAGIGDREVDCVFGGAPCQGFSMIGQRVLDDPRNSLVLDFVRLVVDLKARSFVFENVKGLTLGKHRKFLDELVAAFDKAGYDVRLPWSVLDAADFGVPQHRQRLILFGARKGEALPIYPQALTRPADRKGPDGLAVGPTCRDAIDDLPDADKFDALEYGDTVAAARYGKPSLYAAEMRGLTNDAWHFGYPRRWDKKAMTSSWRTGHTEISRQRFAVTVPGSTEPISRFYKLRPDGLSNTLRAGTDGARGAFTSPRPIHYRLPRCVTVREMARLHGFPDWFRLQVTKWHGARQIGNSVPPPLARAVAGQVILALDVVPTRPSREIRQSDPRLVEMDLTAASAYFGIAAPNSRRDRKSGARKRSQAETEAARIAAIEATCG